MKKLVTLSAILLLFQLSVYPQQSESTIVPNLKYGKPSKEELSLTSYAPDTTATAIYLFHQGKSEFTYHNTFQLVTEHWFRIKILKPQGVEYANVTVPFYAPTDRDAGEERASNVDGCSYNMENGKCVKTPMQRESISFERVDNHYKLLKFSLPAVKEGTVIEYHYKLYSDYFIHIDNWMMQEEIPMIYNEYKILIPNAFIYNIEIRGKDFVKMKQKNSAIHATQRSNSGVGAPNNDLTITAIESTFISENLPAIRQDESYCWCPEDYKVQISFDLEGTNFPGEDYKPYSQKWEDVDKQLLKPEEKLFGQFLSFTNPFRPEAKQLFTTDMGFEEKVMNSFRLLKKKLAWNGRYNLYSKDLNKVIKNGSGSNADLNFIFISILKDFGLKAYPVVLCRRSTGVLPFNFPSLQKLNTFAVAIYNDDKQQYAFLDSSMDIPAFNTLPLDLCVNRARILSPQEAEEKKWVDLMALSVNRGFMNIEAKIEGNQITGHRRTMLQGQEAVKYQMEELQKKDSLDSDQTSESEEKDRLIVNNLKVKHTENDLSQVEENFDFIMKADHTEDHLYINPMLFPQLKTNPFIQSERVLPVEFPFPYKFTMLCTLTLPDGYEVEELPQPGLIRMEGDDMKCKYMVQKQGNTVTANYIFELRKYIYLPEHYKQLQDFWTKVIDKNNALIVLKKI